MTIGLEQGFYSVEEDSGTVEVCADIKGGDIAGRSISIQYTTLEGSANGITYNKFLKQSSGYVKNVKQVAIITIG